MALVPDLSVKEQDLFQEFLSEPGGFWDRFVVTGLLLKEIREGLDSNSKGLDSISESLGSNSKSLGSNSKSLDSNSKGIGSKGQDSNSKGLDSSSNNDNGQLRQSTAAGADVNQLSVEYEKLAVSPSIAPSYSTPLLPIRSPRPPSPAPRPPSPSSLSSASFVTPRSEQVPPRHSTPYSTAALPVPQFDSTYDAPELDASDAELSPGSECNADNPSLTQQLEPPNTDHHPNTHNNPNTDHHPNTHHNPNTDHHPDTHHNPNTEHNPNTVPETGDISSHVPVACDDAPVLESLCESLSERNPTKDEEEESCVSSVSTLANDKTWAPKPSQFPGCETVVIVPQHAIIPDNSPDNDSPVDDEVPDANPLFDSKPSDDSNPEETPDKSIASTEDNLSTGLDSEGVGYVEAGQVATLEQIPVFYPPLLPVAIMPSDFVSCVQNFFLDFSKAGQLDLDGLGELCGVVGLPYYLRLPLFLSLDVLGRQGRVGSTFSSTKLSCTEFLAAWQAKARFLVNVSDEERAFNVITQCSGESFISYGQLEIIVRDVFTTHPGLESMRCNCDDDIVKAYINTVVTSILYEAEAWRHRRIYLFQALKMGLGKSLSNIYKTREIDSNKHFSYQQFYVLFVKFTQLDINHDFLLSKQELLVYERGDVEVLTVRVVDRIFETNLSSSPYGLMTYEDFIIFIKSEVDKFSPTAVDYWFKVMDLNSDGYITVEDFHSFYLDTLVQLISVDFENRNVSFKNLEAQLIESTFPQSSLKEDGQLHLSGFGEELKTRPQCVFTLPQLKKNPYFPHLLDAFLGIFQFIVNDESSDQTVKRPLWQTFLAEAQEALEAQEDIEDIEDIEPTQPYRGY